MVEGEPRAADQSSSRRWYRPSRRPLSYESQETCCGLHLDRLDKPSIQPYGCIHAGRPTRLRSHVRRSGRHHPTRHRAPGDRWRGGRGGAGPALPHELRGGPEARRDPRAGRPRHQGAHRAPEGRPDERRGAARGAPPARPVRGAVARADRPHVRARGHADQRGHEGASTDDRDRRPQGPRRPDPDPRRRVRRLARPGLAAVGRSAPARALVGPADLPGYGHVARPAIAAVGSSTT